MKHKVSISIDEDVLLRVMDSMRGPKFRNKSHFFQYAAEQLLGENDG